MKLAVANVLYQDHNFCCYNRNGKTRPPIVLEDVFSKPYIKPSYLNPKDHCSQHSKLGGFTLEPLKDCRPCSSILIQKTCSLAIVFAKKSKKEIII